MSSLMFPRPAQRFLYQRYEPPWWLAPVVWLRGDRATVHDGAYTFRWIYWRDRVYYFRAWGPW